MKFGSQTKKDSDQKKFSISRLARFEPKDNEIQSLPGPGEPIIIQENYIENYVEVKPKKKKKLRLNPQMTIKDRLKSLNQAKNKNLAIHGKNLIK